MKLLIRKPATHYACVLILLTGLSFKTQAQQSSDSLFVFSSVKVKGIYKTFEEFRKNAPSISFDKIHVEYSEEETVYGGNLPVAVLNTDSVTIEKGTPVWGFCDGSSVFVSRSNKFNKKTTYDKVRYIGRYLYYQTITSNNGHTNTTGPGASTGGYTMGGPRAQTLLEKGVDINTGVVFELSNAKISKILSDDQVLLAEFKKEKKKEQRQGFYLKKYSEKHQEQIKK